MNKQRELIQERILHSMAVCLTIDEYEKSKEYFSKLSDEDFMQFVVECCQMTSGVSNKEYCKQVKELNRSRTALTYENTALNCIPVYIEREDIARAMWKEILDRRPSDHICLTEKEDDMLIRLWEKGATRVSIPSDIFFAETIPLMDCRITIDETALPGGTAVTYRVVIFDDYADRIKNSEEDAPVTVGALVPEMNSKTRFYVPIKVMRGFDSIFWGPVGYDNYDPEFVRYIRSRTSVNDVSRLAASFLETWYGIQIALLHPLVKDVFKHPHKEKDRAGYKDRKPGEKKCVRYIKRHIINKDALEKAMTGGEKNFTRHTLVWYVIGHWRTLANGAKSFVQPYWKGPLRELRMSLEGRSREVIIGGEVNA